jgi:hypothetical protein
MNKISHLFLMEGVLCQLHVRGNTWWLITVEVKMG